jgi:hypothetical protein
VSQRIEAWGKRGKRGTSYISRSESGGTNVPCVEGVSTAANPSRPVHPSTFGTPGTFACSDRGGALVYSDDAGSTWCDRVSSAPRDTHCLAVHPLAPTRLHSAAGDGYFESVDDGNTWRRVVDGLEHQYCWSVAISLADSKTLLLSTSKSAYGAHYKESANSIMYRRTGSDAWKPVRKGLPIPKACGSP